MIDAQLEIDNGYYVVMMFYSDNIILGARVRCDEYVGPLLDNARPFSPTVSIFYFNTNTALFKSTMAARKSCTHLTWAEAKSKVGGSSSKKPLIPKKIDQ